MYSCSVYVEAVWTSWRSQQSMNALAVWTSMTRTLDDVARLHCDLFQFVVASYRCISAVHSIGPSSSNHILKSTTVSQAACGLPPSAGDLLARLATRGRPLVEQNCTVRHGTSTRSSVFCPSGPAVRCELWQDDKTQLINC